MSETRRHAAAQGWAHAQTRQLARRICEGREPQGFARATFVARCEQIAAAEKVSVSSVVLDYASDRRE